MQLQEYFYPTLNFLPPQKFNYPKTDYAEIEIIPDETELHLLENFDRYSQRTMFTEDELKELDDPNNDAYEHMIAYVHFNAGTEIFNRIHIEIITSYDSEELVVDDLISKEEKEKIIKKGLESIRSNKKAGTAMDEDH